MRTSPEITHFKDCDYSAKMYTYSQRRLNLYLYKGHCILIRHSKLANGGNHPCEYQLLKSQETSFILHW